MNHRLFVGLRPPRDIRAALIAVMGGVAGARWQSDDQLHLTARYIGEVDHRMAGDVALAVARIPTEPITVALNGVGRFAKQAPSNQGPTKHALINQGRTNAIWAGVAPGDALARLHRKIDHAMITLGLPAEGRAYLPHITLARLPRTADAEPAIDAFIARHAGLSSAPFAFTHITLFESHLTRDGARYDVIDRWPLGG